MDRPADAAKKKWFDEPIAKDADEQLGAWRIDFEREEHPKQAPSIGSVTDEESKAVDPRVRSGATIRCACSLGVGYRSLPSSGCTSSVIYHGQTALVHHVGGVATHTS